MLSGRTAVEPVAVPDDLVHGIDGDLAPLHLDDHQPPAPAGALMEDEIGPEAVLESVLRLQQCQTSPAHVGPPVRLRRQVSLKFPLQPELPTPASCLTFDPRRNLTRELEKACPHRLRNGPAGSGTSRTTRTTSTAAEEGASEAEDDDLPSCGEIDPAAYVDRDSCVNGNPAPATGTATGEDLAQEAIDADVPGDDIDPPRVYDLGDRPLTEAEVAQADG